MKELSEDKPEALPDKSIGEIVAADYRTARVFEKYSMDFCCGGNLLLADACSQKGIDLSGLQEELASVKQEPLGRDRNYASWALSFLADYIVNTHHVYLNENMAQIAAYLEKIAAVHGAHHGELHEIVPLYNNIIARMVPHLKEEEERLFPAIKRIETARIAGLTVDVSDLDLVRLSLETLQKEHEAIGDAVHEIRRLANGYAIPADVCNTFRLTYGKLEEFEDDLHKHVHLENNILFLKASRF